MRGEKSRKGDVREQGEYRQYGTRVVVVYTEEDGRLLAKVLSKDRGGGLDVTRHVPLGKSRDLSSTPMVRAAGVWI